MKNRRPPTLPRKPCCCPWCAEPSPEGRARWHKPCVTAYRIAAFSSDQRRAVRERDRGVCASCKVDATKLPLPTDDQWFDGWAPWHADHIFPLWLVDRSRPRAEIIKYWSLENLQTLCHACHKSKTAKEAGERARMKRLNAKPKLKKTVRHPGFIDGYTVESPHG